jgi:hypothetical protein
MKTYEPGQIIASDLKNLLMILDFHVDEHDVTLVYLYDQCVLSSTMTISSWIMIEKNMKFILIA